MYDKNSCKLGCERSHLKTKKCEGLQSPTLRIPYSSCESQIIITPNIFATVSSCKRIQDVRHVPRYSGGGCWAGHVGSRDGKQEHLFCVADPQTSACLQLVFPNKTAGALGSVGFKPACFSSPNYVDPLQAHKEQLFSTLNPKP